MQVNPRVNRAVERPAFQILIIEPDVVQGVLIGELIRRSSPEFTTVHAWNLVVGVDLLANEVFDAVWVSTPMPQLTLETTLDKIVQAASGKPVIAMLERTDAAKSAAARARGATDVYNKQAEIAVYFRKVLRRGATDAKRGQLIGTRSSSPRMRPAAA